MDICTLKAGDEVFVFDRSKDKYIKRVVEVDKTGARYFQGDPAGYFKVRPTIILAADSDAVTAEELPAAKKRHAERRKAEKAAEAERERRESDGRALAAALYEVGVGQLNYGERSPAAVYRDGSIDVRLTVEQARVLLNALNGKE